MESQRDGQLIAYLESISITDTFDAISKMQSNFESLPPELIFSIFEYVPEAVCELRLTSRALQVCVDEFVRQRSTISLVHKISIHDNYQPYVVETERTIKDSDYDMQIWIYVPIRTAALFELRLRCRGVKRSKYMRLADEKRGDRIYVDRFYVNCNIPCSIDANATEWASWADSIGTEVTSVEMRIGDSTNLATICRIVQRFTIKKLEIDIENIFDGDVSLILEAVKHHKLERLSLRARSIAISALAEFLLELSAHLRHLYLGWYCKFDVKWVPLIIGMLSRKLDTLHIKHWSEILTREDADRLIAHLPFIGKKVWFKVSFALNTIGRSNKLNGHVIHETCPIQRPNKRRMDRALTIIHKSRLTEELPRG